ncbi:hypothetical protein O9G_002360 [Rozella allomycis CSF55]|uniref:Uncharacterized protein n=1 Tax=Rozella allomycis (strain CSF55) TaxID=988480 RepID=A0A075AYD4_ROZAC|nr:hypothetical protein O9G_002360 [Rozella allomycis CSF55]|eukprot:EPZ33722.1 hypothetical protein O9G_002360 [Rozella allomycis CSF55]
MRNVSSRIDVDALRNSINDLLKERSVIYWLVLKRFLTSRLTKEEFDLHVKHLFPTNQLCIHNDLIHALLCNARFHPVPSQPRKKLVHEDDRFKKKAKKSRTRIKQLFLQQPESQQTPVLSESPYWFRQHHSFSESSVSPMSTKSNILKPDNLHFMSFENNMGTKEELKRKLAFLAVDNDVPGGVSDDCVNAMYYHIKNMLQDVIRFTSPRALNEKSDLLPPSWKNKASEKNQMVKTNHLITHDDLDVCMELCPSIVADDISFKERNMIRKRKDEKVNQNEDTKGLAEIILRK